MSLNRHLLPAAILAIATTLPLPLTAAEPGWGAGLSLEAYGGGQAELAEATLGVTLPWGPALSLEANLLYEAGATTQLDSALLHYGRDNAPLHGALGLAYLPFGNYSSQMVSKPLTLDLGETAAHTLLLGYTAGGLDLGLYVFQGGLSANGSPLAWGLHLRHQGPRGLLGFGWVSDLGDSKTLSSTIIASLGSGNVAAHVGGANLYYVHEGERHQLVLEWLSALGTFQAGEVGVTAVAPQALALEYGRKHHWLKREAVLALGYQASSQAADLGLARQRWLATGSLALSPQGTLALEYRREQAYGGTMGSAWTLQYHLAW